ncbi:MAG: beta-galactosidase, partial [Thermoguttaceae bacterium]|nr:beta-galactosidase [Thermoguttaceae bacterium]
MSIFDRDRFSRRDFGKLTAVGAVAGFLPIRISSAASVRAASDEALVGACPYGVCAHLGGGEEYDQMPRNLEMMRKAGISWVRADFTWHGVEREKGEWSFEHLDRVVEETNQRGIQVLPILDYGVPWATPAFKYLDEWKEYVRRIVERFKDRIRFW